MSTTKERSVFVGNIPYDVTEEMLTKIFSEVGKVLSFRLVVDRDSGKPKGYGFCEYTDGATALSAMRNLNGYDINGRNLRVDFAEGGSGSNKDTANSTNSANNNTEGSLTGPQVLAAIENAIETLGPVKIHDLLTAFQVFCEKSPQHAKIMLAAHPAMTHGILQIFEMFDISKNPIVQPESNPSNAGGLLGPPPSSNDAPNSGGLLGPNSGGLLGPPPLRKMPNSTMGRAPPPIINVPMPRDPRRRSSPPPNDPRTRTSPPLNDPRTRPSPPPNDPRRRAASPPNDPRRAKKAAKETTENPIEALVRDMTPAKLAALPADERKLVSDYMKNAGIHIR